MSTTTVAEYRHFIAGEWDGRRRAARLRRHATRTRATSSRRSRRGRERTPRARSRRRRPRSRSGRRPLPPCVRASSSRRRTSSRAAATRSCPCSRARRAARSGSGCSRWASRRALLRQAAGAAYTPVGEVIPSDMPGALALGIRQPVGVVGAIAPWNAALILSLRSITAPIVYGNTVVLKPSELLAVHGRARLGRDLRRGGLPGRRAEHRHARTRGGRADRRRARREPGGPAHQLHGLHADRTQARRGCRPQPQAGRARARRLQPADRPRRCRRRLRRGRVDVRVVPPPGADLHVRPEDPRRALDRGRRSSRSSWRRRGRSSSATRTSTTRSSGR